MQTKNESFLVVTLRFFIRSIKIFLISIGLLTTLVLIGLGSFGAALSSERIQFRSGWSFTGSKQAEKLPEASILHIKFDRAISDKISDRSSNPWARDSFFRNPSTPWALRNSLGLRLTTLGSKGFCWKLIAQTPR